MANEDTRDGWTEVSEQILLGLAHEINNRLLALMGIRELGEHGPLDAELLRLFDDELVRLESANRILRRLGEADGGPETVEGSALLEGVREIHARNAALRGVRTEWSVADALPAVRLPPVAAERALLRALASSGRAAGEGGVAVEVSAAGEDGALLAELSPAPRSPGPLSALERAGATVEAGPGGIRIRFTPA